MWYAGAPEIATRWWKDDEKPSDAEQKIIDQAKATVWRRRDPKQSFQEGFKSKHYTAFDQQDFNSTVADYLEKPWLQHPFLDWVMVDMMVSRELSAFGEELKINFMPGPRGLFGAHARYFTSGGNLVKMKMPNWESLWKKALLILFPIGLIYSAFHSDYNGLGAGLLALCSAAIAL